MVLLALFMMGIASAEVGAVMEPADVVEQYRNYAKSKKVSDDGATLRCRGVVEELQLCATIISDKGWRYATMADSEPGMPATVGKHGFVEADADGVGRYWVRALNDGKEGLFFHSPELFKAVSTGPLVVAWPKAGVVIAWTPGNPMLDKVVSVGVARMVDVADHAVSPLIFIHNDQEWMVWGEAKKAEVPAP